MEKAVCGRCGKSYDKKRFWQSSCSRKCQLEAYYIRKANEANSKTKEVLK